MILSHIDPLEFMDSPEWIGADEYHSTTYQVVRDALRDLVTFVQFKRREKYSWRSVTFSKVAGFY